MRDKLATLAFTISITDEDATPTTPPRAIKRLRPNPLAEYELRAGSLRVLYNVEGSEVVLLVVGRKVGNKLVVKGQEFHGHQDNPPQPPGSGPAENAE